MHDLEAVIGLEIHAQLSTETKLFCRCSTRHGGDPNTRVCPVCLGLPGALPVTNSRAVRSAVRAGLAMSCRINRRSYFERKNYFYPDCPKNYQITQYREPLCSGGYLETGSGVVRINRVHLEEDAGKLVHENRGEYTLIDMNRSGIPLIEIVSEPDLRTPAHAREWMQNLRDLLRYIGVCDGNMERGNLRCDANVSLRRPDSGSPGTKTEIKNLNSFRFVQDALEFEIGRQARIIDSGGTVAQDTLLWDPDRRVARVMRTKEEADDYRYFPEPDLFPLEIRDDEVRELEKSLPELPQDRADRFVDRLGIPRETAAVLVSSRALADYFEDVAGRTGNALEAANWMAGVVLHEINELGAGLEAPPVPPAGVARLLDLVGAGKLSRQSARDVFHTMVTTGKPAEAIIDAAGLGQINDEETLRRAVEAVLAEHPEEVGRYLGGKAELLHFFVGRTMKKTGGRANPEIVVALIERITNDQRPDN